MTTETKTIDNKVGNTTPRAIGGDGAYMPTTLIGKHPILSQFEKSLSDSRPFEHDLEAALGQYLNNSSTDVVDKVIETLYGKNGDGIPYFVEQLAPRLGIDIKKLDKAGIDKLIGKYGIIKETLKGLITAKEKFDTATISQITSQLASQLFADFMQGVPGQVANIAYKNGKDADEILVAMQGFLRGPNAARNLQQQLKTALTPDRKQAIATGIIENAYPTYRESTSNLYR